jgi:hypothetical protein
MTKATLDTLYVAQLRDRIRGVHNWSFRLAHVAGQNSRHLEPPTPAMSPESQISRTESAFSCDLRVEFARQVEAMLAASNWQPVPERREN